MRLIITLITSLILLLPASGQGLWERVYVNFENSLAKLKDVQFVDRDNGFFICNCEKPYGVDGYLFKTEDGGKTWNCIYKNDDCGYMSVYFVNESRGFLRRSFYLLNENARDFSTSADGGYNWGGVTNIDDSKATFFVNDSIGWICNHNQILKTLDGGDIWDKESWGLGEVISLFFFDDGSGWAVGYNGYIAKYILNDGWKLNIPHMTDYDLRKVSFIDQDKGWIAGDEYRFRPIFLRTVDGGENWDNITDMSYLINDFYFENKDHGWAVGEVGADGESSYYDSGKGVILETFNGGLDWDMVTDTLPGRLNALHIADGIGWAVGDNGLILKNESLATGIKEDKRLNSGNEPVFQNYPNPFQSTTIISFQLPTISNIELIVYDISGRKVTTLVNETQQPDRYELEWNAEGMEAGIYFCELKTGQGRQVMKMSIVR